MDGNANAAPEASTSTSPTSTYVPPRPWEPKTPLKSILKRPPPPSKSFFNNLGGMFLQGSFSKLLPSGSGPGGPSLNGNSFKAAGAGLLLPSAVPYDSTDDAGPGSSRTNGPSPLRRAHFILPHLTIVYPISSSAAPSSAELTAAKLEIEEREREARCKEEEEGAGAWSLGRVEEFYRECCKSRNENVVGGVIGAFRQANLIAPRTLDLTSVRLTVDAAAALADVLSIEWGLRKLILRECDLDELSLKPLLHALLIPGTLPYLSLSSNKRLKAPAFRLIGVYIDKSSTMEFLDLSQTPLDKRSIEYIVSALESAPAAPPFISEADTPLPSLTQTLPSPAPSPSRPSTPPVLLKLTTSIVSSPTPGAPNGHADPSTSSLASSTSLPLPSSPKFPPLRSQLLDKAGDKKFDPTKGQLVSLRLDECSLKSGALDVLAHAIRPSSIQNLSLRSNRIGPTGAVALALMIKDYPDSFPQSSSISLATGGGISPRTLNFPSQSQSPPPAPPSSPPPSAPTSLPPAGSGYRGLIRPSVPLSPPPRHPFSNRAAATSPPARAPPPQTTYTPYIPRSKRNMVPATPSPSQSTTASPTMTGRALPQTDEVPLITSSRAGGITTRHPVAMSLDASRRPSSSANIGSMAYGPTRANSTPSPGLPDGEGSARTTISSMEGHSAALLDKVRSLDSLPRLGALQTLDLRGNELRGGVTYIAQVLKRNRTLKILNLAENRVDVNGFVAIAEALKYNSTLETLDMSRNPCCGPSLEGVTAIRTAVTINTTLKRLFLSGTSLTSSGAIALAEFLPDARRLLHLDLTHNPLDIAGVMALSVGLKVNQVMRCLDVNVPPNDAEMARLSREILRSCVRNTERIAEADGTERPDGIGEGSSSLSMSEDIDALLGSARGGVWGLIERSELARGVKQDVERERVGLERQERDKVGGKQKLEIWRKTPEEVLKAARDLLRESHSPSGNIETETLLERGQALVSVVLELIQVEKDPARLEELLELNDRLTSLIKDLKTGHAPYASERPSAIRRNSKGKEKAKEKTDIILSPSFSIADSDDDDDEVLGRKHPNALNGLTGSGDGPADLSSVTSPTDLSKSWVQEEGEIFRKGNVLLGTEEMDQGEDISSEELKRELLEAQVERPRPRLEGDEQRWKESDDKPSPNSLRVEIPP